MNALNLVANFVLNPLIIGAVGAGIAINHGNSAKSGFLIGALLGVVYTIWAAFNGFVAPIL